MTDQYLYELIEVLVFGIGALLFALGYNAGQQR